MDKRLKYLNALHSFESAARHQSYSKAAEELFVSQAAISQQMRQLEQALAVKLFTRSGRNMLLTQSGEKLFHACRCGFNEIVQGLNSIQCEGVAGDLTITSTQAFCSLWLMPRIHKFSLLHPEINIKILGSNQIEDLEKKHIDLAIRFSASQLDSNNDQLYIENFGSDHAYPVIAPQLMENYQIKQPKDLLKCRLVSLANEKVATWKSWFEHAGASGYDDQHSLKTEVTSSDMALCAVIAGHGVALAASTMAAPYIKSKQLIVPFDIKHPATWQRYLAYPVNTSKKTRINIFCQWVKNEMMQSVNSQY